MCLSYSCQLMRSVCTKSTQACIHGEKEGKTSCAQLFFYSSHLTLSSLNQRLLLAKTSAAITALGGFQSTAFPGVCRRCPGRTLVLTCETTLPGAFPSQPCSPAATIYWCAFLSPVQSALNTHTHSIRVQV